MFRFHGMLSWIGLVVVLSLTACQKDQEFPSDPREVLRGYIQDSFQIRSVSDRKKLEQYVTGDVKSRLSSWSDDQFEDAFIQKKRKFVKLVFKEVKGVSNEKVNITYELVYLDQGKQEARVTNKKLCTLTMVEGKWLIESVRNIKELIEYRNEMDLP